MEEDNKKKGKRSVVDASVVLSFAVAIFAVFSLAMADISLFQKSGVSYAAPTTLPDSFTFNILNNGSKVAGTPDGQTYFSVPMYVANNDEDNPIFCVEHNVDPLDGGTYSSGETITDYGLLYLLNNSAANQGGAIVKPTDSEVLGTTDEEKNQNAKYANAWITQAAIWMYLYETNSNASSSSSNDYISPQDVATIKSAILLSHINQSTQTNDNVYASSTPIYEKYIKSLVSAAMNASDVAILNVQKASDELSQSENKDFYFSSLITVTGSPSSALKSYTVTLDGIEGAKAVDEDGAELPAVVNPGTKFYVRIPAEKVTKEVQKVTVSVNGTFATLEGKYYATIGDYQKVVSVKAGEKTISKGTEVEFIGTDDTGMSTVQTIYFIGLIVLLCGVGIVYANAKPVQVKQ